MTGPRTSPDTFGDWRLLDSGDPTVFGIRYEDAGDIVLIYNNLSDTETWVKIQDLHHPPFLYEALGDVEYGDLDSGDGFEINGYGFRWLQGRRDASAGG